MTTKMEDFMNEQNFEHVLHLIMRNFEKSMEHQLTDDEKDYFMTMSKVVFDEFTVVDDKEIKVANEEEKEHLDDLIGRMVASISGLIVYFIHSKMESYVYRKRIDILEGLLKDLDLKE